jgi:flagellar biosynthesis protein
MSASAQYRHAAALSYDRRGNTAPAVILTDEDLSSDEIVRIARRFGVPVIEDPNLAKALSSLPRDEIVPERLYHAVAANLARIFARLAS